MSLASSFQDAPGGTLGVVDGLAVGDELGCLLGLVEGENVGAFEGGILGDVNGLAVGDKLFEGESVGEFDGVAFVPRFEAFVLFLLVGRFVGDALGGMLSPALALTRRSLELTSVSRARMCRI